MQKYTPTLTFYAKIIFVFSIIFLSALGSVFAQSFSHPGILNSQQELDFIKSKINNGEQPWKNAFDRLKASPYAALSYVARPKATTDCGSYNKDKYGNTVPECKTFVEDAMAAYSAALMWYFTEDKRYAAQASKLINAWSNVYISNEGSNARLNVSWAAPWYANAAELLKYGYSGGTSGWSSSDMQKFDAMMIKFLPYVKDETMPGNNWIQSAIEAHFAIAIYTNNHTEFNNAVARWKTRVKTYIYQTTDGPIPTKFKSAPINGVCMETARDLGHMKLGINSMLYAAQSAFEQGVDLFAIEQKRLSDCLELHGSWMTGAVAVPQSVNGGMVLQRENQPATAIRPPNGGGASAFEIAYNHLNVRLKRAMPYTKRMIDSNRPANAGQWVFKWETLTHGNLPFSIPTNPCGNNIAPSVSIASPGNNTQVTAGASITITVNASDNGSITEVELFNGTTSLGKDATAPYSFTLNQVAAQTYSLRATATDNCGAKTTSGTTTVVVNPAVNTAPTVSITSPVANAQFNAGTSWKISASASDADGIGAVAFYLNSTLLGQDNTVPYEWTIPGQTAGTYTLKATATDTKGTSKEATISVMVNAIVVDPCAGIAKPTVALTSPSANASFSEGQTISITANAATAASTISKVEFFDGATLLFSDNSSPYAYASSTFAEGTHNISAKATDACGNVSTSSASIITVHKVVSQGPILGANCAVKNQSVQFSINPANTLGATNYSWWFTGASNTVVKSADGKSATITLSQYFTSGNVCVGVNLSSAPYYMEYCKGINTCSSRQGLDELEETQEETTISVYPNPTHGKSVHMKFSSTSIPQHIQFVNSLGNIVKQISAPQGSTSADLSEVPDGIYQVKFQYDHHIETQTLIINK